MFVYALHSNLGFCQIYTDGSKANNGTAAAAVSGDVVKSLRITSHASIFTAELVAPVSYTHLTLPTILRV